ncbi:hypothetical protein [Actinobacillus porcinus]|uniref:hypothetical protein n=1 Tax=Actinobacillus porcinus TaxID=51048 RepID=UPI002A911D5D|nr:hypothetical protein [Actinobacillus porcinus]MDY6215283.1 hypothetical protein [Actinobacillus porcinus]
MNLENKFLLNEIFEGRMDIAIFILDSKCFFVFDDKENFTIDIRPFYNRYLSNGNITREQYDNALKIYRGGAFELNKCSIKKYFSSMEVKPKNIAEMSEFFSEGYTHSDLIKIYHAPINYQDDIDLLKIKLPKFYIDFDTNYFAHTYRDRFFEKEQPENWFSIYSNDFLSFTPLEYKYWVIDDMDFSKF